MIQRFIKLLIAACFAFGSAAHALEPAAGPVLLSVSGDISVTNADGIARFDRQMLESVEWVEVTSEPSSKRGPEQFTGPRIAALLDLVGATGTSIRVIALDDYSVEMTVDEVRSEGAILALLHNGKPMRVRTRGPIRVIYPNVSQSEETYDLFMKMAWQVVKIEVLP